MSDQNSPLGSVLGEYRRYREAVQLHLQVAFKFTSTAALREIVRRLGLRAGPETDSEMTLAMDLAMFAQKPGRSRTIDRYAQAAPCVPGSAEATVLAALCAATFHLIRIEGPHDTAGLVVSDIVNETKFWVMDEGLAMSATPGDCFATRLIALPQYRAMLGSGVPLSRSLLEQIYDNWDMRRGSFVPEDIDDTRFQELLYATAIGHGAMHGIAYR